jgi:hypothetical protein
VARDGVGVGDADADADAVSDADADADAVSDADADADADAVSDADAFAAAPTSPSMSFHTRPVTARRGRRDAGSGRVVVTSERDARLGGAQHDAPWLVDFVCGRAGGRQFRLQLFEDE